jgi:hypothetical protein
MVLYETDDVVGVAFVASLPDPGNLVAADSVMQVDDGILLVGRIPRRRINRRLLHSVLPGRIVERDLHFPVRNACALGIETGGRNRKIGRIAGERQHPRPGHQRAPCEVAVEPMMPMIMNGAGSKPVVSSLSERMTAAPGASASSPPARFKTER